MVKLMDEMLVRVTKPARYTGGEVNMVVKDPSNVKARFAMCFPDVYEVGMSHIGTKILYHIMNLREDTYCERVFAPWIDMEEEMRKNNIPLFSLETKDELTKFDIIGFTLQYEMSYTNILNMLDLSGIPMRSRDREGFPLVAFGGPCASNPEPLADIADFFIIGDGEEVMGEILDVYIKCKELDLSRTEILEELTKVEGVYVPAFYDVLYNEDGTINNRLPKKANYPETINRRIVRSLDDAIFPDNIIVPLTEIVHDRVALEASRGCTRGCRFCQAGMIYRPVRERRVDTILKLAESLIKTSGYDEISLTSLSICDYSEIQNLVYDIIQKHEKDKVAVSLPSLRIDSFSVELINEIQKVRKTGLTFAPEAGTQRMRDIINKGVTEEDLINSVTSAFEMGWSSIKLYFMIGLPYETLEDVAGIGELAQRVVDAYFKLPKEQRKRGLSVNVSASSFVPKPFTPFQWAKQDDIKTIKEKQMYLKDRIKNRKISYSYHESNTSFLEGVFSRGDRRLGEVLIKAWENGCKFDGWNEYFKFDSWMESFEECGVDPEFYTFRDRSYEEILPWDFINIGVTKKYLMNESEKAAKAALTPDCRESCTGCGINVYMKGGECFHGATNCKVHQD